MNRTFSLNELFAAFVVSISYILIGFVSAYTGVGKPTLANNEFLPDQDNIQILYVIMPIMSVIAALLGSYLLDEFGRQKIICCTNYGFFVGFILLAEPTSLVQVVLGRVFSGFCIGITLLAIQLYLIEILSAPSRGMLSMLPMLLCELFGIFLNMLYLISTIYWSSIAYVSTAICAISSLALLFIPESPRWYLLQARHRRNAEIALIWLRYSFEDAENEFRDLLAIEDVSLVGTETKFFDGLYKIRRATLAEIFLMFLKQVFQLNDYIMIPGISGNMHSLMNSISTFTGIVICFVFIDKIGRKRLLTVSFYLTCLNFVISSLLDILSILKFNIPTVSKAVLYIIYKFSLSIGLYPIPWIIIGEISPVKYRCFSCSLAVSTNFIVEAIMKLIIFNFAEFEYSSIAKMIIYTFFGICGIYCIQICLPETMGQTLEDIEFRIMYPIDRYLH